MSTELFDNKTESITESKEISEPHSFRDPKVYAAILKIRAELKTRAAVQRQKRLNKEQKCRAEAMRITVLHQIYLRLRGKEFEGVHNIREGWEWFASSFEEKFCKELDLDTVNYH